MLAAPLPSRRVATLQGSDLYRAHERRAAAAGLSVPASDTTQLERCGTELEAVVWFWWRVTDDGDDRVVLMTHQVVASAGRLCPIDFAFCLVDEHGSRPGVALFLDDPRVRRVRPPAQDRTSALEKGGWIVRRLTRDEINRDPLGCLHALRARLRALLPASAGV
jgi:hypothetical protein